MRNKAHPQYEDFKRALRFEKAERLSIFLRVLATSAISANQINPSGWSISFQPASTPAVLRLNVARRRALDLWRGGTAGLVLDGQTVSDQALGALRTSGVKVWKEPGSVRSLLYLRLPLSKLKAAWKDLEPAHKAFIERALKARSGRSLWWRSHSTELVRYVRAVLKVELPQPSYVHAGSIRDVGSATVEEVIDAQIEKYRTESAFAAPRQEYEFFRREGSLVTEYADYLQARGASVSRKRFRIKGERGDICCDLYNRTRKQLIEAKGSDWRGAIRMAIGELADYRHHLPHAVQCAVLLPSRPSPDIEDLLSSQYIGIVWRERKNVFKDNANGRFCQK